MFINSKINYDYVPKKNDYPNVCKVLDWKKVLPNTENVKASLVKFIVPKWQYVLIDRDFQDEINSQYLITPKMIMQNNITLNNNKDVNYQTMPLDKYNATDIYNGSRDVVNDVINKQAQSITDNQLNKSFESDKDKKIKDLEDELNKYKTSGVK